MPSRTAFRQALIAAALVAPLLAGAATSDTFANGESIYGQAGERAGTQRVVDVSSVKYINVDYGDTVLFRNGDKRFTWTFNGLDSRAVELAKIAPADFGAGPLTIYVARDPLKREP